MIQSDALMISKELWEFCETHPSTDDAELVRLTTVFLLNSFGSSRSEVRLCRFCALFNHSCEPCALPQWETAGESQQIVGMRLLRDVAAGEEITFAYMSL